MYTPVSWPAAGWFRAARGKPISQIACEGAWFKIRKLYLLFLYSFLFCLKDCHNPEVSFVRKLILQCKAMVVSAGKRQSSTLAGTPEGENGFTENQQGRGVNLPWSELLDNIQTNRLLPLWSVTMRCLHHWIPGWKSLFKRLSTKKTDLTKLTIRRHLCIAFLNFPVYFFAA